MQLSGRTVLVTGGASGLGGAVVEMVVEAGGRSVVIDINDDAGRALEARHGNTVHFVRGDVTVEADMQRAVDVGVTRLGGIHALVNAAGIPAAERVLPKEGIQPLSHFERVIRVNLIGTFNAIRLAAAAMSVNEPNDGGERGVIVNTASVAAFDGQIGQAAYAASKGGIVAMTLPLAREFAQHGIRVVTVAPGVFDTPMVQGFPERVRARLTESLAFPQRFGEAVEFAQMVKAVVENPMINGETIRLDGALRMGAR